MSTLLKLTWVEIKLFIREPITVIFTLALPVIFLFVMGGVFATRPAPRMTGWSFSGAWAPSITISPPISPW
jgi:ABC-2 type transport system permease protein